MLPIPYAFGLIERYGLLAPDWARREAEVYRRAGSPSMAILMRAIGDIAEYRLTKREPQPQSRLE